MAWMFAGLKSRAVRLWTSALGIVLVSLLVTGCGGQESYTVKAGESLADIALQHDVALTDLIKTNQDRYPSLAVDPEHPRAGTELTIPGGDNIGLDAWFARLESVASPPITPAPDVPAAPNEKIKAIVQLIQRGINHERAINNLPVLVFDEELATIAQSRSNDMIRRSYFSHDDPQRGTVAFQDLIRQENLRYLYAGENIAEIKNQGTLVPQGLTVYSRYGPSEIADQFVVGWIHSAEHRENIMNPHFGRTGIALGVSVDGTRVIATQIFAD